MDAGAIQSGYSTPAAILAAKALLDQTPDPTEAEVRAALGVRGGDTLVVTVGGVTLRRAYSPAGYHGERDRLLLAIKRMPEGRVSGWANEHLQAGQGRHQAHGPQHAQQAQHGGEVSADGEQAHHQDREVELQASWLEGVSLCGSAPGLPPHPQ